MYAVEEYVTMKNGAIGLYMLLFYGKKKAKVHKSV